MRVKNKILAPVQITVEQILREACELQEAEIRPPRQKITDATELGDYRLRKRKAFMNKFYEWVTISVSNAGDLGRFVGEISLTGEVRNGLLMLPILVRLPAIFGRKVDEFGDNMDKFGNGDFSSISPPLAGLSIHSDDDVATIKKL